MFLMFLLVLEMRCRDVCVFKSFNCCGSVGIFVFVFKYLLRPKGAALCLWQYRRALGSLI